MKSHFIPYLLQGFETIPLFILVINFDREIIITETKIASQNIRMTIFHILHFVTIPTLVQWCNVRDSLSTCQLLQNEGGTGTWRKLSS